MHVIKQRNSDIKQSLIVLIVKTVHFILFLSRSAPKYFMIHYFIHGIKQKNYYIKQSLIMLIVKKIFFILSLFHSAPKNFMRHYFMHRIKKKNRDLKQFLIESINQMMHFFSSFSFSIKIFYETLFNTWTKIEIQRYKTVFNCVY